MLRIVLADDNYLVREGVRRILEDTAEVAVVAAVGTASELIQAVDALQPDAVITDIRMPPAHHLEGIAAAHRIRAAHPHIGVVVLSQHADEAYAWELLKSGTAGLAYLLKDRVDEPLELLHAIREVIDGRSVIDAVVVDALLSARRRRSASPLLQLTPRELDVLTEMARGRNNAAIGRALSVTESAVEKYASAIFAKLGLSEETDGHRRVLAVLAYLQNAGTTPAR